jgi:hypothetical protein
MLGFNVAAPSLRFQDKLEHRHVFESIPGSLWPSDLPILVACPDSGSGYSIAREFFWPARCEYDSDFLSIDVDPPRLVAYIHDPGLKLISRRPFPPVAVAHPSPEFFDDNQSL